MNKQEDEDLAIATITKSKSEEIHIAVRRYKGHLMLDLRIFTDWPDGEMKPTKKGIAVPADKVKELMAAMSEAANQIELRSTGPAQPSLKGFLDAQDS